jgi:hypothetical protein
MGDGRKIKITDSDRIIGLPSMIDPKTGNDWIPEFMHVHGAFGKDEELAYEDATGDIIAPDDYAAEIWAGLIEKRVGLDKRIAQLNEVYGDEISEYLAKNTDRRDIFLEDELNDLEMVLDQFEEQKSS